MTAKAKPDKTPAPTDQELWQRLASGVKPLKRRRPEPPAAATPAAAPKPAAKSAPKPVAPPPPPPQRLAELPLPTAGKRRPVPGLDSRTAERLRKGEIPIEARLDLHGLTQAEASAALSRFVQQSRRAGLRCLLVITGKGARRVTEEPGFMPPVETGVLKQLVPRWLAAGPERAHILAIATARPQHGGAGALYVLLRKAERG